MRKKILKMITLTAFLSFAVCGCQKAPGISSNGDILHARGSAENEIAEIVASGTEAGIDRDMNEIHCLIGTEENGMRIEAPAPYIPDNIYHMVLKENSALDLELLEAFLESDSGEVVDLSEQRREQAAQADAENERSEEKARTSSFGTDSIYVLSDGKKEAGFFGGTGASYQDKELDEKCASIYKTGTETVFRESDIENAIGNQDFSVRQAKALLLDKLAKIQVTEIHIDEVYMYESRDFVFYEMRFTPSYEGMGVISEVGSVSYGEDFPDGSAWVCRDGVARLNLRAGLGEAVQKDRCEELLSWEQVEKIIEANLKNGTIHGSSKIAMPKVEFVYYPILSQDESELELVPVWHVYIPSSVWMEDEKILEEIGSAVQNICVNAISGEIVRTL